MKILRAIFAGILGALAMSLAMAGMRSFGLNVSLEALLGSMFPPTTELSPWTVGFLLHLAIGGAVAIVYSVAFEVAVQRSGILVGIAFGIAHGLMAGLFMSAIPAMNPLDARAEIAPGPFLWNLHYGPLIFLLLHALFGMVVGLVYGLPLHRPELSSRQPA